MNKLEKVTNEELAYIYKYKVVEDGFIGVLQNNIFLTKEKVIFLIGDYNEGEIN